jgi:hypothetical protein
MIGAMCLIADWKSQCLNATTIHAKLVIRFHEKVPAYSPVTNSLRPLYFGEEIFEPGIHSVKRSDGLVDFKVRTERTAFLSHGV